MGMARRIDSLTRRGVDMFMKRVRHEHEIAAAYLFGSRARGDHSDESDADVALIIKDPAKAKGLFSATLGSLTYDVLMETGILVSVIPYSAEEWQFPEQLNNPYLVETIKLEGIAL